MASGAGSRQGPCSPSCSLHRVCRSPPASVCSSCRSSSNSRLRPNGTRHCCFGNGTTRRLPISQRRRWPGVKLRSWGASKELPTGSSGQTTERDSSCFPPDALVAKRCLRHHLVCSPRTSTTTKSTTTKSKRLILMPARLSELHWGLFALWVVRRPRRPPPNSWRTLSYGSNGTRSMDPRLAPLASS